MKTTSQAFLFNADVEGISHYYGGVFDPALLKALSSADPSGLTFSRLLRGDVFIASVCEKVTAVSAGPKGSSYTIGHDMELYRTVIWDLVDALVGQDHTLDLEALPMLLARQNIYCLTLPTAPEVFRDKIDCALRSTEGYLGTLEVDLGSPVQRSLFMDRLLDYIVVKEGSIFTELSWEGEAEVTIDGASEFFPNGKRVLPFEGLQEIQPPIVTAEGLSARGLVSIARYEGKRASSIEDRVIYELSRLSTSGKYPYEFRQSSEPTTIIEADLPQDKFVLYLLNKEKEDGKGKAKFFSETLGIGVENWRYLAAELYKALLKSDLTQLKIKNWEGGFGASFNCDMSITGLNGRVATIFTNWIMEPGKLPRLSTAYPTDLVEDSTVLNEPIVAAFDLAGDYKWEKIYELADSAGKNAAERAVPTPMKVVGYAVEMEGLCGSASIRILEARRGFARWVIRSGKGHRHYKSGAQIFVMVDSQSIDRAAAYAKAFASVLKLNGIECTTESRLD